MAKPMRWTENLWHELDRWENEGGAPCAVEQPMPKLTASRERSGKEPAINVHRGSPDDIAQVPAPHALSIHKHK